MQWRWDQGRLDYFQIDEIRRIANALIAVNGRELPHGQTPDYLRVTLSHYSARPFAPSHYKVWRNYKRVFGCQMLATEIGGVLVTTDLCKQLATGTVDSETYLSHIARFFYYPSPVFDDYAPNGAQVFPICAIIKLLVATYLARANPTIKTEDVIRYLKGNSANGTEPLSYYLSLVPAPHAASVSADEERQVRELLRFISQFSFLKWKQPNLILDVSTHEEARAIANFMTPLAMPRLIDPGAELIQLAGVPATGVSLNSQPSDTSSETPDEIEFIEGSRVRKTHLRIERSAKLRELFFQAMVNPHECDMCSIDTIVKYPWSNRLVELHHLLPLSSPIRVEQKGTSLKDIVGLCPTCHRATHKYYAGWLKGAQQKDFNSQSEAKAVYQMAKSELG